MEIRAQVKKQPGSLILETKYLLWKTDAGSSQTIDLTSVDGMKATPPTAASCRILLTGKDGAQILKLDFPNRDTLDKAKEAIQQAIQVVRQPQPTSVQTRATDSPAVVPTGPSSGSGTPAPSSTSSQPAKRQKKAKLSLDPQKLLANFELQRTALQKDKNLQRTFQETVMNGLLTNDQFWSMRLELLITSAQESGQRRGAYNVLSTIKPVTGSDNQINLSLTRDKIHDIFDQYPIVRKAYNENVPSLSEGEFWQKFFMSRFFLHLRGERISNNHPWDPILDKYIDILEESIRKRRDDTNPKVFVPMYLDVNGNANDVPELSQAPPDPTMRIGSVDSYAPGLIRQFNGLSRRLVSGGRPQKVAQPKEGSIFTSENDANKYDAQLMEQIKLTDLQTPTADGHTIGLNLNKKEPEISHQDLLDYKSAKEKMLATISCNLDLSIALDENEEALSEAQKFVTALVQEQGDRVDDDERAQGVLAEREVMLCHATTLEFLRHYMDAVAKNLPLAPFRDCLSKSLERIDAAKASAALPQATADALQPLINAVKGALE